MTPLEVQAKELAAELLSQDLIGPGTPEHIEAEYMARITAALRQARQEGME